MNVGWSTSHKRDLGFDLKFLNNNLSVSVDLFKEHRKDIFLKRSNLPDYTGFVEMPYGNLGVVDNKGVEAMMEWNQPIGKNINLTV